MKKICSCGKLIPFNVTCGCNKRVSNKATEGETDKLMRTTRWKKKRLSIIKRDNAHCQRCVIKYNIINNQSLTVHHIKPRNQYPELMFDDTNLITLCQTCNGQLGTSGELDFEFHMPDEHIPVL